MTMTDSPAPALSTVDSPMSTLRHVARNQYYTTVRIRAAIASLLTTLGEGKAGQIELAPEDCLDSLKQELEANDLLLNTVETLVGHAIEIVGSNQ